MASSICISALLASNNYCASWQLEASLSECGRSLTWSDCIHACVLIVICLLQSTLTRWDNSIRLRHNVGQIGLLPQYPHSSLYWKSSDKSQDVPYIFFSSDLPEGFISMRPSRDSVNCLDGLALLGKSRAEHIRRTNWWAYSFFAILSYLSIAE